MKRLLRLQAFVLGISLVMAFALPGCGKEGGKHAEADGHGHDEGGEKGGHGHEEEEEDGHGHGEEEGDAPTSFKEGKGLTLIDETKKAIGLETAEVSEHEIQPVSPVSAQIYRTASEPSRLPDGEKNGSAYATAIVPPDIANHLEPGSIVEFATGVDGSTKLQAKVWKVETTQVAVTAKAEILIEVPDPENKLHVGSFLEGDAHLSGSSKTLAVPRSAVLETATGRFVYVQNGEFFLRTAVTTGAESAENIEITDGLYEGDSIVTKPAETLYIIELRATKGGGHSH
jgi:hypothetical protein